jgi:Sortase domain
LVAATGANRSHTLWGAAAVLSFVVASGSAALAVWPALSSTVSSPEGRPKHAAAGPVAVESGASQQRPTTSSRTAVPSQALPGKPTALRLPDGTRVAVRAVPTLRNGLLAVPPDIRTAGWWDGGSRVGDPFGALVIAGHVDSATQGLGPFAELLSARRGDLVRIWSRQLRETFRIRTVEVVAKSDLPNRSDVFAPSGGLRLVLITCSGPYDPSAGGYQNLAVLTAQPVNLVSLN